MWKLRGKGIRKKWSQENRKRREDEDQDGTRRGRHKEVLSTKSIEL